MLEIRIEKSFKKDIQRDKKSGNYSAKDFDLLKKIIDNIIPQEIHTIKMEFLFPKSTMKRDKLGGRNE